MKCEYCDVDAVAYFGRKNIALCLCQNHYGQVVFLRKSELADIARIRSVFRGMARITYQEAVIMKVMLD